MATLNFYLDKADKNGRSFIQMTYLANGQKFRHSIKYKLTPTQWLVSKQRVRVKQTDDEFVNSHLNSIEDIIRKAEKESLLVNNSINFSFVKQRFNDALDKRDDKKTFFGYFNEYMEAAKGKLKESTISRYKTCLNHLTNFRTAKKYELTFERINGQFYKQFVSYLTDDCKILNNTTGNYVKMVKAFMNFATDMGYNKSGNDFKKFKVFKEDSELIYLSEEELLKLFHLKLTSAKLSIVRDNFCFACFTGLRYSDITKLKKENIKDDYIEIKTEKTRDFLKIPLNIYAKQLLAKNNGFLPKLFSNQKTNDYLKDLGKVAEINEPIHIVKYRGVEKVEFLEPKHNFISTHTARRTFVTISLEKGMRPETVMSITGHKDYKTFKKYIKLTDKVKLAEMNNIWSPKMHVA
ncbi:site-specific integrase [Mucilaginibacter sp.]|uniref:site-specific integrase n=1 Tax=Mucilaginibacter sp. TaxID=1882438 RepID=UPI003D12CBD0